MPTRIIHIFSETSRHCKRPPSLPSPHIQLIKNYYSKLMYSISFLLSATPSYKSSSIFRNPKSKVPLIHNNNNNRLKQPTSEENKMRKCKSFVVFPLLLQVVCFLLLPQPLLSHQGNDFSRQPPRPVIFTPHHRSESDPQQVTHYYSICFIPQLSLN